MELILICCLLCACPLRVSCLTRWFTPRACRPARRRRRRRGGGDFLGAFRRRRRRDAAQTGRVPALGDERGNAGGGHRAEPARFLCRCERGGLFWSLWRRLPSAERDGWIFDGRRKRKSLRGRRRPPRLLRRRAVRLGEEETVVSESLTRRAARRAPSTRAERKRGLLGISTTF